MFICCAVIIVIIQYCNFCQLNYWMRSTLATSVGLALLAFLFVSPCRYAIQWTHSVNKDNGYFIFAVGKRAQSPYAKDIDSKVIKKHLAHTAATVGKK